MARARQLLAMADELAGQARDEPSADDSVLRVGALTFGLADGWRRVRAGGFGDVAAQTVITKTF